MVQFEREGVISELTDLITLQSNDLIIGEYEDFQMTDALNRNISVLSNRLGKKMSKTKMFNATDIECNAPVGYILVTDGPGMKPYWIDPVLYQLSISQKQQINTSKVLLDYSTINSSQFTVNGCTVTDKLTFTDGTAILNPLSCNLIEGYKMTIKVTPIKKSVLSYTTTHIVISGEYTTDYKLYGVSDVGLIEIIPTNVTTVSGDTKIDTSTQFKTLYSAYMLKLTSEVSIDSPAKFVSQSIEDITLDGDDFVISYAKKESNTLYIGAKFTSKNSVIKYVLIDLYERG